MKRIHLKFILVFVLVNINPLHSEPCDCKSMLQQISTLAPPEDPEVACKRLARIIISKQSSPFPVKVDTLPQSTLQPAKARPSGTQGTTGQTNAVPSIEPVALTGGSVALSGTGEGTQAVTAISVNPSLFASQTSESFSKLSRFSDLTILLPVSLFKGDIQNGLNFVGVNARMNVMGPSEGEALFEKQKKQIEEVLNKALNEDAKNLEKVEAALKRSSDLCECAKALYADSLDRDEIRDKCGQDFSSISNSIYKELYTLVTQAQEKADSRYFGLNIRFERSLKIDTNSSTSLFCGLAGGKKFDLKGPSSLGLRAWMGLQYANADSAKPGFAANGAIGVIINRSFGSQQIEFSSGIEGRLEIAKNEDSGRVNMPNMSIFRISCSIPFMADNSLSIGAAIPISKNEKPMINVGYNWSLMYPDKMKDFVESFLKGK